MADRQGAADIRPIFQKSFALLRGNAPSGISFAADILRTFPERDRLSKRRRTTGIGWARAAPIPRRAHVARKTIAGSQSFEIGVNAQPRSGRFATWGKT